MVTYNLASMNAETYAGGGIIFDILQIPSVQSLFYDPVPGKHVARRGSFWRRDCEFNSRQGSFSRRDCEFRVGSDWFRPSHIISATLFRGQFGRQGISFGILHIKYNSRLGTTLDCPRFRLSPGLLASKGLLKHPGNFSIAPHLQVSHPSL